MSHLRCEGCFFRYLRYLSLRVPQDKLSDKPVLLSGIQSQLTESLDKAARVKQPCAGKPLREHLPELVAKLVPMGLLTENQDFCSLKSFRGKNTIRKERAG